MTPNDQDALLLSIIGESSDTAQARWSSTQRFAFLNAGRRRVAREARCFQIKDSQSTVAGTSLYSVPNDFIGSYLLEFNGKPLRPVRMAYWRDVIGPNEDLRGTPSVVTYFARQFQLFFVPDRVATFKYSGWGIPAAIAADGADPDFTDEMAEASVYAAAVMAKAADDRDPSNEEAQAKDRITALFRQYKPRGPRYVADSMIPGGVFVF